jgi:D-methionine transport system substrate-binding protein
MARALLLMEQEGLIKLKDSIEIPTTLDIVENPKNLKINELHSHQVVSSMADVDACATAKMFIVSNNVPLDTEMCVSKDLKEFGVGFVIAPENEGKQWTKDLITAYTTDEMREEINRIFKGCYVPGF